MHQKMFKLMSLFALALLLVAAAAAPIDEPNVASASATGALHADSTDPSIDADELPSLDEDSDDDDDDDSDSDDDSVLNGAFSLDSSRARHSCAKIACAVFHPRLAIADVSELTENEDEWIKGKLYGNFCGVRYLIHFGLFVVYFVFRCLPWLLVSFSSQNPE